MEEKDTVNSQKNASDRSLRSKSTREKTLADPEWNTGGENCMMRESKYSLWRLEFCILIGQNAYRSTGDPAGYFDWFIACREVTFYPRENSQGFSHLDRRNCQVLRAVLKEPIRGRKKRNQKVLAKKWELISLHYSFRVRSCVITN